VVVKIKAIKFLISFSWSGLVRLRPLPVRLNGGNITAATALTNAATGGGIISGWIGAHDTTDVPRPVMIQTIDGTACLTVLLASIYQTSTQPLSVSPSQAALGRELSSLSTRASGGRVTDGKRVSFGITARVRPVFSSLTNGPVAGYSRPDPTSGWAGYCLDEVIRLAQVRL